MIERRQRRSPRGWNRREVLQAGGLALGGLTLADWLGLRRLARATAGDRPVGFGRAKACILLFMWGGPAHQDTWDLKPLAPREIRGEFQPIATNIPGIQISELLPLLAQRVDRLSIVRSMTHNNVDHTPSTHFLLTGQPPVPGRAKEADWPHLGAVLAKLGRGRDPLPPFVSMRPKVPGDVPRFVEQSQGQFAGWLGKAYDPLTIDANPAMPDYRVGDFELPPEIPLARLQTRQELLGRLEPVPTDVPRLALRRQYERAFDLLASAAGRGAFDLGAEPAEIRDRYGRNPHGQSVLQARRLIERGVPLVTVFWPNDGIKNVSVYWDTHSRNFVDLKTRLCPPADRAFATLLDDLDERGLLDETLVIWTGEFGRTPRIGQRNSDAGAGADGRDHWPNCFSTVLAGGGVRGGAVYGASDRFAAYPASSPVPPVDLLATVYHLLGVPADLTLLDGQNRPQIVCPGRVLPELIA